jgi:AcrR family transcriptional regulator
VIAAAAALFIEQGYAATTIDQIAVRARVSRPTVFAVATKARLLALARLDANAGDHAYGNDLAFQEILAIPDPFDLLRRFARFTASIARRLGPPSRRSRRGRPDRHGAGDALA